MTDIRGYDLRDQEVIDIQASQGVSVSIVGGRREEVGQLSLYFAQRSGLFEVFALL